MMAIGRCWEVLKAVGVVLWPIRFILLVMAAMIGILSLSQGQDALYGAVMTATAAGGFLLRLPHGPRTGTGPVSVSLRSGLSGPALWDDRSTAPSRNRQTMDPAGSRRTVLRHRRQVRLRVELPRSAPASAGGGAVLTGWYFSARSCSSRRGVCVASSSDRGAARRRFSTCSGGAVALAGIVTLGWLALLVLGRRHRRFSALGARPIRQIVALASLPCWRWVLAVLLSLRLAGSTTGFVLF